MRSMIADVEMVLAKSDLGISERYSKLSGDLHEQFFPIIEAEHDLTRDLILEYSDHDLLLERIREHDLPVEAFQWYLDIRRYGTVPHSGFGMGIERFVTWLCGLKHLRETIPYPRMLYRIYP